MPKKQSSDREGVADYNAWLKMNKKFEEQGLYGTDYYIKRVDELEEKVKRLEAKLKRKGKK
tara:strand:- start:288 stop:470 length:183 start_codon:yes stop_codon:yes gene_type:complete